MELLTRRSLPRLPGLLFLCAVCFFLFPAQLRILVTPADGLLAAVPTDRLAPPIDWVDDLKRRIRTDLTRKYPAYDFTPYVRELDRVRDAVRVGDLTGAKREMGRFLSMLIDRAYGLGNEAAEDLAELSQQMMPDDEFAIVYPGSGTEP
jgi:hypothetical protein